MSFYIYSVLVLDIFYLQVNTKLIRCGSIATLQPCPYSGFMMLHISTQTKFVALSILCYSDIDYMRQYTIALSILVA